MNSYKRRQQGRNKTKTEEETNRKQAKNCRLELNHILIHLHYTKTEKSFQTKDRNCYA